MLLECRLVPYPSMKPTIQDDYFGCGKFLVKTKDEETYFIEYNFENDTFITVSTTEIDSTVKVVKDEDIKGWLYVDPISTIYV